MHCFLRGESYVRWIATKWQKCLPHFFHLIGSARRSCEYRHFFHNNLRLLGSKNFAPFHLITFFFISVLVFPNIIHLLPPKVLQKTEKKRNPPFKKFPESLKLQPALLTVHKIESVEIIWPTQFQTDPNLVSVVKRYPNTELTSKTFPYKPQTTSSATTSIFSSKDCHLLSICNSVSRI